MTPFYGGKFIVRDVRLVGEAGATIRNSVSLPEKGED